MKTIEEFKQFYENELKSCLEGLEQQRIEYQRKMNKNIRIATVFGGIAFLILLFCFFNYKWYKDEDVIDMAYIVFGIPLIVGSVVMSHLKNNSYIESFTQKIISPIISFVDKNLSYQPNEGISREQFDDSLLFDKVPNNYRSYKLISGIYEKTSLQIAEISATRKNGKHTETIFDGLFIIADFNKNISGETFVLPDFAEKNLGWIGTKLQQLSFKWELVKLEDTEFERNYVVYSSDQIEARYILTPAMMQRILDLKNKFQNCDIRISFIKSKMYIAISTYRSFLNPEIDEDINNYSKMESYFEEVKFLLGIIDELNLNTRIWGKV